jgi:hypothetical protein
LEAKSPWRCEVHRLPTSPRSSSADGIMSSPRQPLHRPHRQLGAPHPVVRLVHGGARPAPGGRAAGEAAPIHPPGRRGGGRSPATPQLLKKLSFWINSRVPRSHWQQPPGAAEDPLGLYLRVWKATTCRSGRRRPDSWEAPLSLGSGASMVGAGAHPRPDHRGAHRAGTGGVRSPGSRASVPD